MFKKLSLDFVLLGALVPLIFFGLVTMNSFSAENNLFEKQLISVGLGFGAMFLLSFIDFRFLRRSGILLALFFLSVGLLIGLMIFGEVAKGAQSWFSFGSFSFQPVDFAKLVVILVLAKYFSRRHIEIAQIKHIFISSFYVLLPAVLVLLQPDFGSAMVLLAIWFLMVLVSGISKKHLFLVLGGGVLAFLLLWLFVFADYQKNRILTFLHPLQDIHGAGYNAYQSTIAVGSGKIFGKGVGYGTQSRLQFLPEYETDFIFAAFAEEWGLIGVLLMLSFLAVILWRIVWHASLGGSNFETLYALGLAFMILTQSVINIGMNLGLLPVTGLPLPFVSYGGSHIFFECVGLGILFGMKRYANATHRSYFQGEIDGAVV